MLLIAIGLFATMEVNKVFAEINKAEEERYERSVREILVYRNNMAEFRKQRVGVILMEPPHSIEVEHELSLIKAQANYVRAQEKSEKARSILENMILIFSAAVGASVIASGLVEYEHR